MTRLALPAVPVCDNLIVHVSPDLAISHMLIEARLKQQPELSPFLWARVPLKILQTVKQRFIREFG